jgi:ubiquinone/menaquinone biosynthesis C-methylase UbiE
MTVDTLQLRDHVRAMYREVAFDPDNEFHFETGPTLAARLGYPTAWLTAVPPDALASFAGVGLALDLADLRPGESVLDLGSGSGTDSFIAAALVGRTGRVLGVDMTDAQIAKARYLSADVEQLAFTEGLIEEPPVFDGTVDTVISNGVINLVPDKAAVFRAVARALRPGGRLALADIVAERELKPATRGNVALWAACIAGSVPRESYLAAIESAGLKVVRVRANEDYAFLSERANEAAAKYGVTSISLLAVKPL